MEKIATFIYSKSRLIIVIVAVLNIVALASFFRFQLDTDFLSFFTAGNPKAEEFDRLNEKYQIGEAISVLIEQDNSLLDKKNLQNVFRLQEDIEEIEGISQVRSFIPSEISVRGHIFQVDEKKHILQGTIVGILHTGVIFFLLSLFLGSPDLYQAFYMRQESIYVGLLFFGLLYTPIELVLSVVMQMFSRRNEYEADRFAAETIDDPCSLVDALKE
ncbi:unnamed protein product, partial [marine sediment metagenome]